MCEVYDDMKQHSRIISIERSGIIGDYLKCKTGMGVYYSIDNGIKWMDGDNFIKALEMAHDRGKFAEADE